jgi:hypothetical protein
MTPKLSNRTIRAVADLMWKRDQLQMHAADALLSACETRRKPRASPRARRQRTAKRKT